MCSILKVNSSNSISGSPKCWGIVGLAATSKEAEIFAAGGYHLDQLVMVQIGGLLFWASMGKLTLFLFCSFIYPLDVTVIFSSLMQTMRVFSSAVDVHTRKPMCGKAWWINVIKSFNRKDILKPHVRAPQ